MMSILVTGATGYIGSHTVVELLKNDYEVVGLDDFSNSSPEVLERIELLTNCQMSFYKGDVKDKEVLKKIFQKESIDAVIHFAAHKSVGESVAEPIKYYYDNLTGVFSLCNVMQQHQVKTLVFSSSATVYGDQNHVPFTEDMPLDAVNPYGQSKVMIERILKDLSYSRDEWKIVALRYFNPVGAHPSGMLGEDPNDVPSNLMPYISQVAVGKRPYLNVFGNQYNSHDGTGIRDYVHVQDLALGHVKAIEYLKEHSGFEAFNLGSNKGYSVLEVVAAYEKSTGVKIPFKIVEARLGDVAESYSDCEKALNVLKWKYEHSLEKMCYDAWNWQVKNPNGYVD